MDLTINTNRQSVNRHSDFTLRMSLLKDGEPYTPTSFVMAFYVDEWDCETVYTASLIGGEFINCSISGDVISVYFDHPHFPLGTLKCRVVDKVRDINFKDGTFDTVTPITLPVEIVTGGGTDSVDVGDVTIEGSVGYMPPEGGIPKSDLAPDVQASLGKADTALQTETDPTVPAWAKQPNKPTYTAQEVGALPADTPIPTKTSDLNNDSGFITEDDIPEGATVDSSMSSSSDNPVKNKVIKKYVDDGLADKQDTISDLATIRSGAAAGATAYQKPASGIPASDIASGVIPDVSGFATKTEVNAKADKSTTYTKTEVDGLVANAGKVKTVSINGETKTPDSNGNVDLGTVVGEKGEKGDTGATGPQGPAGPAGAQGNSGVASADGVESVNNLNGGTTDTSSRVYVLGANQGKRLRDQIDYVYARLQAVYSALGNIAFWDGKTSIANILPELDWGNPKHTVTLALSLTNAVVKHNGVAKANGDSIQVEEGGTLTLTIEPASGYALTTVTSSTAGATVTDLGNGTYSVAITMGQNNLTLSVTAATQRALSITYALTDCAAPAGVVNPASILPGDTATIQLQAATGYTMPASLPAGAVTGATSAYTRDTQDTTKATIVLSGATENVTVSIAGFEIMPALHLVLQAFVDTGGGTKYFIQGGSYNSNAKRRAMVVVKRADTTRPCTWGKTDGVSEDPALEAEYTTIPVPRGAQRITMRCGSQYYYVVGLLNQSGVAQNNDASWTEGTTQKTWALSDYPDATHIQLIFKIGSGGTTNFSSETYASMGIEFNIE